jgi:hypothetical protein
MESWVERNREKEYILRFNVPEIVSAPIKPQDWNSYP